MLSFQEGLASDTSSLFASQSRQCYIMCKLAAVAYPNLYRVFFFVCTKFNHI